MKEIINLVYIDDIIDEEISKYLEDSYTNDKYDIEYQEESFNSSMGYEYLLKSSKIETANVILIDSKLFENDRVKKKGKLSGEEFKMILKKVFPFIEVLVISQNGADNELGIIPKYRSGGQEYRSGGQETSENYYNKYLKTKIDDCIDKIIIFRNIAKKLKKNNEVEKYLVEKTTNSLYGINDYDALTKKDIDELIDIFKKI